jgi:hypothetical protein
MLRQFNFTPPALGQFGMRRGMPAEVFPQAGYEVTAKADFSSHSLKTVYCACLKAVMCYEFNMHG